MPNLVMLFLALSVLCVTMSPVVWAIWAVVLIALCAQLLFTVLRPLR